MIKITPKAKPAAKKRGRPKKVVSGVQTVEQEKPIPIVETEEKVASAAIAKEAQKKGKYFYAVGRRKTSVAKVRAYDSPDLFSINRRPFNTYLPTKDLQKSAISPLALLGLEKKIGLEIYVSGGGIHSQSEAIRHAIARMLIIRNPEDRMALRKAGFLTRDSRVKERKKPGLKRARRGPQWAKR